MAAAAEPAAVAESAVGGACLRLLLFSGADAHKVSSAREGEWRERGGGGCGGGVYGEAGGVCGGAGGCCCGRAGAHDTPFSHSSFFIDFLILI
jgi:hypothetical protein